MASPNNSEASFVFSSMMEFLKLWSSGQEGSLRVDCKDGKDSLNFSCHLGKPDDCHFQHGRCSGVERRRNLRTEFFGTMPELLLISQLGQLQPQPQQHFQFKGLHQGLFPVLFLPSLPSLLQPGLSPAWHPHHPGLPPDLHPPHPPGQQLLSQTSGNHQNWTALLLVSLRLSHSTVEQKNQSCEFRAGSQICHSWPLTEFKNINKKIYKLTEATPIDF